MLSSFRPLLLWLIFASGVLNAQNPTIQWVRQFGTAGLDAGVEVATAPDGVYVGGFTNGSFPTFQNAGGNDALLRKYDSQGNLLWTRQYGTSTNDSILGLTADANGVYVAGGTGAALPGQTSTGGFDSYVRKYDPSGNIVWTRQFGSTSDDELNMAALDATGLYVAGRVVGALPGQVAGGPGTEDAFVRKYDLNGTEIWTRQFGTPAHDSAISVSADSSGLYIAGLTQGNLASSPAGTDAFLRKYDPNGTVLWTRQITSQNNLEDIAWAVTAHSSGVYVCGQTSGTFAGLTPVGGGIDSWIRKYDLNGAEQWTRQFGTAAPDSCNGLAGAFNWIYAVVAASGNVQLVRFQLNGALDATLDLNSSDNEFLAGVAADATGAYVTGQKDGSSLGQTPAGGVDALLLKVEHPPLPPAITSVGNAFGGTALIAPNTWVAIKGTNLSAGNRIWLGPDFVGNLLPVVMDNVRVTVNNKPAYIYFISPTQINILTPPDALPAQVQVEVTNNGVRTNVFTVAAAPQSLSFFEFVSDAGKQYVYGRHASDNSIIGPPDLFPSAPNLTTPVKSGESIYIAATGFGDTNVPIVSGALSQSGTLPLPLPVIRVNGVPCTVTFAGLVSVGTYQINFILPANLPDGDLTITATYNGREIQSNLFIAVKN